MYVTLKIPTRLEDTFKNFLDIAQFNCIDDEAYSKDEQEVLKIIRKYLGKQLSTLRGIK